MSLGLWVSGWNRGVYVKAAKKGRWGEKFLFLITIKGTELEKKETVRT